MQTEIPADHTLYHKLVDNNLGQPIISKSFLKLSLAPPVIMALITTHSLLTTITKIVYNIKNANDNLKIACIAWAYPGHRIYRAKP
jgi:hypothetical protein